MYIYIDPREAPYSVAPRFVFLYCLRHWSSLVSITIASIFHWVCHGNLLSNEVSAGIPLHSTPRLIPLGDSLLQRLNTA